MEQLDSKAMKALSVDTRQKIVKMLVSRPYTASELAKIMSKHVTTIGEHLDTLEDAGLVRRRDDGHKWIYYVLTSKGEHMFKPQIYSWTIMLSISLVVVLAGGAMLGSQLFVGGYGKASSFISPLQEASGSGSEFVVKSPVPLADESYQSEPAPAAAERSDVGLSTTEEGILYTAGGIALIIVGVVGIALALRRRK